MAEPVLEVVAGWMACAGEVRDLVLGDSGGVEAVAGELVEVGRLVVRGDGGGSVTGAVRENFGAEAGVFVDPRACRR